jgi:hypothetical protein
MAAEIIFGIFLVTITSITLIIADTHMDMSSFRINKGPATLLGGVFNIAFCRSRLPHPIEVDGVRAVLAGTAVVAGIFGVRTVTRAVGAI